MTVRTEYWQKAGRLKGGVHWLCCWHSCPSQWRSHRPVADQELSWNEVRGNRLGLPSDLGGYGMNLVSSVEMLYDARGNRVLKAVYDR